MGLRAHRGGYGSAIQSLRNRKHYGTGQTTPTTTNNRSARIRRLRNCFTVGLAQNRGRFRSRDAKPPPRGGNDSVFGTASSAGGEIFPATLNHECICFPKLYAPSLRPHRTPYIPKCIPDFRLALSVCAPELTECPSDLCHTSELTECPPDFRLALSVCAPELSEWTPD